MIRLATAGLSHEANTFAPTRVGLETFADSGVLRGQEIVDRNRGGRSTMAGYLDLSSLPDVSITPLLFATVTPAGEIERSAFETIVGEMVSLVREGGPWDGILLALHGAAVAEGYPDADGEILRRLTAHPRHSNDGAVEPSRSSRRAARARTPWQYIESRAFF